MGKCSNCGKKILYNKYHMYRGKVLCYECYDTRQERKKAKKAKKIVEATEKSKEEANKYGVDLESFNPYEEPKEKSEA